MNKNLHNKEVDQLFDCIMQIDSKEELYEFLEDLCTINEIKSWAQRLEVAKLLTEGRIYLDIAKLTGASTATISRVNRALKYGNGAYERAFERMESK